MFCKQKTHITLSGLGLMSTRLVVVGVLSDILVQVVVVLVVLQTKNTCFIGAQIDRA